MKPVLEEPPSEKKPPHKDPFAPPYEADLVIGDMADEELEASHVLLLNKYLVVPHHFLMVTKEYESQAAPLSPGDLVHSYQLLVAARNAGRPAFAFYNCGDKSGASQPHKHVQFLPVAHEGSPIEQVARKQRLEDSRPFTIPALPYAHFIMRLNPSLPTFSSAEIADSLIQAYLTMIDLVVATARQQSEDSEDAKATGAPSYNVVLSLEHMLLVPRRHEAFTLSPEITVPVNSLGFAGMLLAKTVEELDALRSGGLTKVLSGVAMVPVEIPATPLLEGI